MDANLVTSVCGYLLAFAVLYFVISLIHLCIPKKHSEKLLPRILSDPFGLSCALISLIVAANAFWGRNHNAEAARQLEKIVESTEFIGDVALPDSLEQTDEVRSLRVAQRDIQAYKIHLKAIRDVCPIVAEFPDSMMASGSIQLLRNIMALNNNGIKNAENIEKIFALNQNAIKLNSYYLLKIQLDNSQKYKEEFDKLLIETIEGIKANPQNYMISLRKLIEHSNFNAYLLGHADLADAMNQIIKMRLVEISRASYENAFKQNTNK